MEMRWVPSITPIVRSHHDDHAPTPPDFLGGLTAFLREVQEA